MFIDRAKIHVQGGDGGNGVTAFRREKFVPRGGPSGGDGGRGGDVFIVADSSLNTLLHLRYNPQHIADRGRHGEGSNRSGHDGDDHIIRVPVGTQIFDANSGELLFDLAQDGARSLAVRGGRGGFGNSHFATSTNRAPRYHQTGSAGEERDLHDIPGLIEGAHMGAGLGDRFLRHIERTKLLLHLVDVSSLSGRDTIQDYETVNRELASYNPALATRSQIVVATKIDAVDEPERLESLRRRVLQDERPFFAISSVTGKGIRELVNAAAAKLDELNSVPENKTDMVELAL